MIECDVNKNDPVNRLLRTAPDRRDDKWKREFLSVVVDASFECRTPQVFIGPDGFSYFGLHTPQPDLPFNAYCICNLVEPLTEQGIGISINPQKAGVDWVFSSGDLLSYRLYGTFDAQENGPAHTGNHEEVFREEEQVLVSQPSESYLPTYARRILRRFMEERLGVKNPGVFLMSRASLPSQHLVFSVYPQQFASVAAFHSACNALTWFLPRHYSVVTAPGEAEWARHFQAL